MEDGAGLVGLCRGRVRRIGQLFGYTPIITYTLEEEAGASLRAVGAEVMGKVEP